MSKLWGGRFDAPTDAAVEAFTTSLSVDARLWEADILGSLAPYLTITGFVVTPVVGAIVPPLALTLDPTEVADAFEVPLAFLLDPANHQRVSREYNGLRRAYYAMPYGDRYIWGDRRYAAQSL